MLKEELIVGPDRPSLEPVIDRTLLLKAESLWPDPLACPDWPILREHEQYGNGRGVTRADALGRLEAIGQSLNRGAGPLTPPTAMDAIRLRSRVFRKLDNPDHSWGRWGAVGFRGYAPLNHTLEHEAELIVEAALVRGFLRKLDAAGAKRIDDAKREKVRAAQHRIDHFRDNEAAWQSELASLAEAEARHAQRLADERAVRRAEELRQTLYHAKQEAQLGESTLRQVGA